MKIAFVLPSDETMFVGGVKDTSLKNLAEDIQSAFDELRTNGFDDEQLNNMVFLIGQENVSQLLNWIVDQSAPYVESEDPIH